MKSGSWHKGVFEWLNRFLRNLRYALRSLRRTPAYAVTAILTLALGIGANTAIFSVLDGVVLKPLPFHEPDRLVLMLHYNPMLKYATYLSYPDFIDWQRNSHSFEQISAFTPVGFDLTNPGLPEHVSGYEVSSNFFSTLGVNLALGRSFSPADDRVGGMPAAVISHRLWQERFHGSPSIIGKSMTLNGSGYTITGVLSPKFRFENQPADVYTPVGRSNLMFRGDRTVHDIACVARLKNVLSLVQAQAEMNTVQERIDQLNPVTEKSLRTYVVSLKRELVGDVSGTLMLLLGAVGFVLLIACANVANLLLARSAARTREFAVRRALGASQAQITLQLLTESVLLSLLGGTLGLLVAKFGLSAVLAATPKSLPRMENIGISVSVLLFALIISTVVGILFGLVPALKHAGVDLQTGLRAGGRGLTHSHQGTQNAFVIMQIALALVLLSGAGLLFRTIHNLGAVNPGFDTQHVMTFQVGLSPSVAKTAPAMRAAYQQIIERIRQIPGIESAGITGLVPLGRGSNSGPFWRGKQQPASMAEIPRATYYPTSPDYPRTMQIPLLRGRFLTQADAVHSEPVILVDSSMAHTYFPDRDALGQTLTIPHWGPSGATEARIVGIVGHVKQYGIDGSGVEQPQIYYSLYQLPDEALPIFRNEVTFAIRTFLNTAEVMPAIKNAVYDISGDLPVYNIGTVSELMTGAMARQRFPMILLLAFSALALLLASVGVYGVMSYSVTRRVPEMGVRMALGATNKDIRRMVVEQGLRLAAIGIVIGVMAAVMLARILSSFSRLLYGVHAIDPLTLLAVSLCLAIAALLACYIPARRAAQLEPVNALRQD